MIDWDIGHTHYRDFASRMLPQVCMSQLPFSVDGNVYYADINMLDPDVHGSAKRAAYIHSVDGIEDSLRAGLVQYLRNGLKSNCGKELTRALGPMIQQHQPALSGFCPAFAKQSDYAEVADLVLPIGLNVSSLGLDPKWRRRKATRASACTTVLMVRRRSLLNYPCQRWKISQPL